MSIINNKYPYSDFHELNLDWVLQTVKEALDETGASGEAFSNLTQKVEAAENEIEALQIVSKAIKNELDSVAHGDYVYLYLNSLSNWIDDNLQQLVSRAVKFVSFYLDDTGHFCADIPETWEFLEFDSVVDTNSPDYGCLILEW